MKVLVTGGAGFIGSHMVGRLVGDGHDVIVIDNESTGRRDNVPPQAHYFRGDVAVPADLDAPFALRPEAVFHIAGQVSMIRSFSDPLSDLRTNVQGTVNVLQCCLEHRVKRLLYASSMTVYGNTAVLPTPETAACEPVSYYGITKYAGERYVLTTAERTDLKSGFHVTCFRMYSVYGPGQALDNSYQGVLGIFLGNLQRREPVTVFGDGEQTRDFVYVADVVDAWVGALTEPASFGKVFNLGSGQRLSINRLADETLVASGRSRDSYQVLYAPGRPGEQRHVEADIRRARAELGWQPRISFHAGLQWTVEWATREQVPALTLRMGARPS